MARVIGVLASVVLVGAMAVGQQTPAAKKPAQAKRAAKGAPAKAAPAKTDLEAKPASKAELPSEATVNAFLKRMFGYDQNLVFRVAGIRPAEDSGLAEATVVVNTPQGQQITRLYITPDQKHAVLGDLIPFGTDPFAKDREELKAAFGPTKGPKDAPVTIVEFGDLQCPACKQAQPNIEKLVAASPNARLVFQNFPLEQIHPWAMPAARYVDCLARTNNDGAWTFIQAVYTHQGEITEANVTDKLNNYAKMAGADPAAVATCAATPETTSRIQKSLELGKAVGITGTPTLFINGRKIGNLGSIPVDALKSIVDFEAEQASTK